MLQRIQSIYLLLAGIVSAISIFFPLNPSGAWQFVCAFLCVAVIATIFLFKKRLRQITLCNLWIFLSLLQAIGFGLRAYLDKEPFCASLLPVGVAVLVWLARRGIKSDEAKVRAADRIR